MQIYISYLYIVFKILLSRKVVPRGIKIRKGHGNFEDRISCSYTTKQTLIYRQWDVAHTFLTPDGPVEEMVYNSPPPFYTPTSAGTVNIFRWIKEVYPQVQTFEATFDDEFDHPYEQHHLSYMAKLSKPSKNGRKTRSSVDNESDNEDSSENQIEDRKFTTEFDMQ